MLAVFAVVLSAWLASFCATFVLFFPRVPFLEHVFLAAPIGLSVSAWFALIIKSLPFARPGLGWEVILGCIVVQCAIIAFFKNQTLHLLTQNKKRIQAELSEHKWPLVLLAAMSVWWVHQNSIHYLFQKGSSYFCGGSVYADLPFHLNLVTSFVYGCNMNATVTSSLLSPFYR